MTLLLLAGIAVALLGMAVAVGLWSLHERHECPACGAWTQPVRSSWWLRATRLPVSSRWCLSCGWEGYARAHGTVGPPTPYLVFRWGRKHRDAPWEGEAPRRARTRPRRSVAPPDDAATGWREEE